MKKVCVLLLALICVLSSCKFENSSDDSNEILYFDNLGYRKNGYNSYQLVYISRYTKSEIVIPEVLPNGCIVESLFVKDAPNIESLIMSKHVMRIQWDQWHLKHLFVGEAFEDISQLEGFSRTLESIEVSKSNPFYYSENNCVIEKRTETLVLGCKNSVIPDNVWIIGRFAFASSDITSIEIPDYVARICISAVANCKKLEEVYLGKNVIRIERSAFYGTPDLIINCEASEKPSGWDEQWCQTERADKLGAKTINWGVTREG